MKPFIIITGDDSVRAPGIILLKKIVEKICDYQVVATRDQQSAVGAALKLGGGDWGHENIDGHEAIWVDGYPSDAVYFAFERFKERKIDLVLSGVNHGENIQTATMPRSGTLSAALTATMSRSTPSVAFSMRVLDKSWRKDHDGSFDDDLLKYPGDMVEKVIRKALEYKFSENEFWNVNFPANQTEILKVVEISDHGCYPNHQIIEGNKFKYTFDAFYDGYPSNTDAGAIQEGFATISSCRLNYLNKDKNTLLNNLFN